MFRRLSTSPVCAAQTRALSTTAVLLGNKGGTPKMKKSPYKLSKKYYGVTFKETNMKQSDWYYCPLCSEPKKEGEWCRREDCRQIKP